MGSSKVNEVRANMEFAVVIGWPKAPRYQTTDPNHELRPWLEANVGKQKRDWDWEIYGIDEIKVLFAIAEHAMMFKLIHGER